MCTCKDKKQTAILSDAMEPVKFTVTDEGFLMATGRLARTGIQEYRAIEISRDLYPDEPLRIIRVYRPHSEVFDRASMQSFENKPITLDHPVGTLVNAGNWKDLAKGEVRDVHREGDLMVGTLIVKDADAIAAIKKGYYQLSNGYTNDLDFTPGKTPSGEDYDAIQRHIRGNHVALVKQARCGEQCSITIDGENLMTIKLTIDGIPVEVSEIAAAAIQKLQGQVSEKDARIVALGTQLGDSTKAMDALTAKITALESDLKAARDPSLLTAAAKDWAVMVADGVRIVKDFTPEAAANCVEYKRAIVTKAITANDSHKVMVDAILGGKALSDATDDSVQAAFRLLASLAPAADKATTTSTDGGMGKTLLATTDRAPAPATGMALFHQRMRGGFVASSDNQ